MNMKMLILNDFQSAIVFSTNQNLIDELQPYEVSEGGLFPFTIKIVNIGPQIDCMLHVYFIGYKMHLIGKKTKSGLFVGTSETFIQEELHQLIQSKY